ncbi:alpha/beta hydrolase fold domain-containing protein [Salinispira pacifica]|uniref:Putative esterase n=1 Tax=Salinispira pacifica TaxID=1307761 RepID=V5WLB1_9SPIO|nr:alpha/beta hydrolase fold domain-containing protein [Salinispira pacifica]AHC16344.1 putative esterase [Salinispira pacifica]
MPSPQSRFINYLLDRLQLKRFLDKPRNRERPEQILVLFGLKYEVKEHSNGTHGWLILSSRRAQPVMKLTYLHGGGFVNGIHPFHVLFIRYLIDTLNCIVLLPDYPLAPEYTVSDVYEYLMPVYFAFDAAHQELPGIIMGDSSGGNLTLGVTRHAIREGRGIPRGMVLLSPWLDLQMDNPDIDELAQADPVLDAERLRGYAVKYAGKLSTSDPIVSPIHETLEGMPPTMLLTGDRDILNPDARLFRKKAEREGLEMEYHEFSEMVHVWMLFDLLPEAQQAREMIRYFILRVTDPGDDEEGSHTDRS